MTNVFVFAKLEMELKKVLNEIQHLKEKLVICIYYKIITNILHALRIRVRVRVRIKVRV